MSEITSADARCVYESLLAIEDRTEEQQHALLSIADQLDAMGFERAEWAWSRNGYSRRETYRGFAESSRRPDVTGPR